MTRVLFSGYYGFGNAGDEAVLNATLRELSLTHPGIDITVLSASPTVTACEHGVRALPRMNPLALANAIFNSDLVVSGGGGLLQDVTSQRSLFYYLSIICMAKAAGKKTVLYGQGFGPINSRFAKSVTRHVLNRVDDIGVRDPCSAEEIEDIGVRRPVEVAADPALLLQPERSDRVDEALRSLGIRGKRPIVGLCLRPWGQRERVVAMGVSLAQGLSRLGSRVVLVPMQPSQDVPLLEEILVNSDCDVGLLRDRLHPRELMAFLGSLDLVVGMRLHSLIFASVMGVPCVGLVYDPKVQGFLDAVRQPALTLGQVSDGEVAYHCEHALTHPNKEAILSTVSGLQETARRGLDVIRRHL